MLAIARTDSTRVLLACIATSAALHVTALFMLSDIRVGTTSAHRSAVADSILVLTPLEPSLPPPVPPTPPPPQIQPGIEDSTFDTDSWMGFADPTPHSATPAEFDQPALTMSPGVPSPDRPSPDAPQPTPRVTVPAPTTVSVEPTPEQPATIAPITETLDSLESGAQALEQLGTEVRELAREGIAPLRTLLAALRHLPSPAPAPPSTAPPPAPDPTPAPPLAPSTDAPSGEPAQPSDRESSPVSLARVELALRELGNPAAAEGVDIRTVRPRFTHFTRIMASPKDPLIRVEFDATGAVVNAEVLESSGHRDVDRPILDAIYQWKASGKAIQSLKGAPPPATATLDFRIVL